jgi:hypothetical protein
MARTQGFGSWIASALGALAVMSFSAVGAGACEMSVVGKELWLRGHIVSGDQFKFHDLIDNAGLGRIVAVHLDSPGGDIYSAGEIARQIRTAGLSTVVDASQHRCASSCTIIFVGGVRRIYRNADRVGGLSNGHGFKGLGFHEGAYSGQSGAGSFSSAATSLMVALYQELGVPGAAGLVDNAPPEAIYGLSGPLALKLGIATNR